MTGVKIVGLGEGGAKAISKMIAAGVGKNKAVEFIAIGNDENIMLTSAARKNIFLNRDLGTIYRNTSDALSGAKLIIIVAGLAGNAARAALPTVLACAKGSDAVTVAFVCKPSILEDITRKLNADYTLNNLRGVDTLFVMPAEKFFVFRIKQPQISLPELFDAADDVFCQGVKIFLELKDTDLKFGNAAFGYAGGNTPLDAMKAALNFPTLEENVLKSARKIFIRVESAEPLTKNSLDAANNFIKAQILPDAHFFFKEEVNPLRGENFFASIICSRK